MNIEEFRNYCLSLSGSSESLPFGEDTLVFKVGSRIFALTGINGPFRINLKCDPELAISLREQYPSVTPGYHMSKKHWNTVIMDGSINDDVVYSWIDHSYQLVFNALKKSEKESILTGKSPATGN